MKYIWTIYEQMNDIRSANLLGLYGIKINYHTLTPVSTSAGYGRNVVRWEITDEEKFSAFLLNEEELAVRIIHKSKKLPKNFKL